MATSRFARTAFACGLLPPPDSRRGCGVCDSVCRRTEYTDWWISRLRRDARFLRHDGTSGTSRGLTSQSSAGHAILSDACFVVSSTYCPPPQASIQRRSPRFPALPMTRTAL